MPTPPEKPEKAAPAQCGCSSATQKLTLLNPSLPSRGGQRLPDLSLPWVLGSLTVNGMTVPLVSGTLAPRDYREHLKCRTSSFRNHYTIVPGLYAIGSPDADSDVFATANYKYSFDKLRSGLRGMNAWILVLDTKGINVWCAAGKGTFSTDELVRRMKTVQLDRVVKHRRIIVPQLGAVGVSAPGVAKQTGFRVSYGPVDAKDIPAFAASGRRATPEMRLVRFGFSDRLVLTPMEVIPALKHYPLFALVVLLAFGLRPEGILFADAFGGGMPFLLLGIGAVLAGAFVTPLFLPFIPFRAFSLKGLTTGMASTLIGLKLLGMADASPLLLAAACIFFPLASSYIALQFTGSTTFTGMSGVKKELKVMIPLYLASAGLSAILLVAYRIVHWRVS